MLNHLESRRKNVLIAQSVAEVIRTSLGPNARSKLIVKPGGEIVYSRDGAQVLRELRFENPVALVLAKLSSTLDSATGDGTTSGTILAGALCAAAIPLLERGIHFSAIVSGYHDALQVGLRALQSVSRAVSMDEHALCAVARTCMGNRPGGDVLSACCVAAMLCVRQALPAHVADVPLDRVKLQPVGRGHLGDCRLVRGAVVHRTAAHPYMPHSVQNARIGVLSCALEAPRLRTKHTVAVSTPEEAAALTAARRAAAEEAVTSIVQCGLNVLVRAIVHAPSR